MKIICMQTDTELIKRMICHDSISLIDQLCIVNNDNAKTGPSGTEPLNNYVGLSHSVL